MGNEALRSVVITGASTGIGAAASKSLARQGWRVFAGVRREEDGEKLRSDFLSSSGTGFAGPGSLVPVSNMTL